MVSDSGCVIKRFRLVIQAAIQQPYVVRLKQGHGRYGLIWDRRMYAGARDGSAVKTPLDIEVACEKAERWNSIAVYMPVKLRPRL